MTRGCIATPPATFDAWIGFESDRTRKSYYVDGHEREEQIKNYSNFISTYFTEIEPRSHLDFYHP